MLTLDTPLNIPARVAFSVVGEDAFLLDMHSNQYYGLAKVGARFWQLLAAGENARSAQQTLLKEYQVEADVLETDLLDLLKDLQANGLLETA